jgi:hypothetical protein
MPVPFIRSRLPLATLHLVALLVFAPPAFAQALPNKGKGLPQRHDYQKKLRTYLATLKAEDLTVPLLQPPRFEELRASATQFTLAWIEAGKQVLRPPATPGSSWLAG